MNPRLNLLELQGPSHRQLPQELCVDAYSRELHFRQNGGQGKLEVPIQGLEPLASQSLLERFLEPEQALAIEAGLRGGVGARLQVGYRLGPVFAQKKGTEPFQ